MNVNIPPAVCETLVILCNRRKINHLGNFGVIRFPLDAGVLSILFCGVHMPISGHQWMVINLIKWII
jgi:hypothetical protein